MTTEDMAVKLAEVAHRAESNTRRIDKLEQQTDAIQSLAISVEVLVKEQCHQTEAIERIEHSVEKLDNQVEELKNKPAKRWDGITDKIVQTLVGGLIAYVLLRLGLS